MSATSHWRLATAAGTIEISALLDSQPAPARGDTGTWSLKFHPDGLGDHVARYEQLMAYADWAGRYEAHTVASGVSYTETFISGAPGGSLLVALRPADSDPTGRGQWAVFDAIDDSTEVPEQQCLVDVDLAYLAPLDAYEDRLAARDALEAPI